MLLVEPEKIKKHYVALLVHNESGELIDLDVKKYSEVFLFKGNIYPEKIYISVLFDDVNKTVLCNKVLNWCYKTNNQKFINKIDTMFKSLCHKGSSRKIRCICTGEEYESVASCARVNDLNYGQLFKHLKREKYYNTIKSKKYEYI